MSIELLSKRKSLPVPSERLVVIDVTKNSAVATFAKFSPFFPHGSIPVPGFDDLVTTSVEGAWQGLKVFENDSADMKRLSRDGMKKQPLKRPANKKRGKVIGHLGAPPTNDAPCVLLDYVEARKRLYIPMYEHVLKTHLVAEVELLRGLVREGKRVVLLDYDVNEDVEDVRKPLSHASLVKRWVLLEGV